MNDTLGPEFFSTPDSGLIGYYRFDKLEDLGINNDGSDDIRDLSISGSHGDLVGNAKIDTSHAPLKIETRQINTLLKFNLSQNYPNPFNPTTIISFELFKTDNISVDVFSIDGRYLKNIFKGRKSTGRHVIKFNAEGFSSGVYFYRLKVGENSSAKKMILIR